MEHTQLCSIRTQERNETIAAWKQQWPDHCTNCYGAGQFCSQYDPSPAGISLGSGFFTECDPCEHCTARGTCPRCGKQAWTVNEDDEVPETPCPHCHWNWS